jgi:hypothetical protein
MRHTGQLISCSRLQKSYGHTLTWGEKLKPATDVRLVHAQVDVDLPKFSKMFVDLMSAGPPARVRPNR